MSFFEELKRRNVIRVGIAYAVASWLLLQMADVLIDLMGLDPNAGKYIVLLLIIGFVPALIFAWAFEMTPEGLKREKEVDRSQSIVNDTGRKLDRIIIGILVVALGYFIYESRFQGGKPADPGSTQATVAPGTASGLAATPAAATPAADRSIAVLPFANRSNVEEDLYFTDGIHDDLLTQLAKIKGLKVISRTSVMKYRDTQLSIPEIARELGVATIMEGGIQRAGKRVRINAQLIDVVHDQHVWAETFDREMTVENIFDIQSEISRQIVTAVRGELSEEESAVLAQRPTESLEAYEAYLQATTLLNRPDYVQDNYMEAEVWLKKATELDPQYAQAWAALVEVHGQAAWIGYDSSAARRQAAQDAVQSAVKHGHDLPETLAAEGEYLYRITNDYPAAVEKYRAATVKAPGSSRLLERLAVAQRRAGLFEGAIANFQSALELDPENARSATLMVDTMITVHRYEEAVPLIEKWMSKAPEARDLKAYRIRAYYDGYGDLESARELLDTLSPWTGAEYATESTRVPLLERDWAALLAAFEVPEVSLVMRNRGWSGFDRWLKGFAQRAKGNEAAALEEFRAAIEEINSLERTDTQIDGFDQQYLSLAYSGLGEFDKAIEAADKAVRIITAGGDRMFGAEVSESRALVLGMAGRRDEAIAEVQRLLELPNGFTRWRLHLDPQWDFFRDDERFNALATPPGEEPTAP